MTSLHPSIAAFFQEATQGTPPVDGAAWVTNGRPIRHIAEATDPSGLKQQTAEDMRSQSTIFGLNRKVRGLRGVTQPLALYTTGSGATTADGQQIALTDLMRVLQHALGGLHRSRTTSLAGGGHTTTVINVNDATDIAVGCFIAVSDTSASGLPVVREVTNVAALAITLDEALPFTPANGDVVHAMATAFIDEAVLINSNGSGGPFTFSWHIQKGSPAALENFLLRGCKLQLDNLSLGRGDLPRLNATIHAATFLGPNDAPSPDWSSSTITGNAPVSIGPNTDVHLGTVGSTTAATIHVGSCEIDFGVPVIATETVTEMADNMEGVHSYATAPGDTMVKLGIVPMASSYWDSFDDDTMRRFRWAKRAAAGQIYAVACPNCEVVETPTRGAQNAVSRADVSLRAFPASGSTALARSKIKIGIG